MNVHLDHARAAHPPEGAFFQRPQQFCLNVERHGGNFIQEQDPLIGHFHEAGLAFIGAGKRAGFEAKQLRFQHGILNGGAIDRDKRLGRAGPDGVNEFGQHFFAGAGFTGDQNRDGFFSSALRLR